MANISNKEALNAELASIWSQVLGVPSIGPKDHFFRRGGDSLMAAEMVLAVETRLGIIIEPIAILKHPVFRDFARDVARAVVKAQTA